MRKPLAYLVAVLGFCVGALVPYFFLVEYLGWGEGPTMKIAAPLALLFAFGGYGLVMPKAEAVPETAKGG